MFFDDKLLPVEIFGKLTYVGMDADGNMHLILDKDNQFVMGEIIKILKGIEGDEVYVFINRGKWKANAKGEETEEQSME